MEAVDRFCEDMRASDATLKEYDRAWDEGLDRLGVEWDDEGFRERVGRECGDVLAKQSALLDRENASESDREVEQGGSDSSTDASLSCDQRYANADLPIFSEEEKESIRMGVDVDCNPDSERLAGLPKQAVESSQPPVPAGPCVVVPLDEDGVRPGGIFRFRVDVSDGVTAFEADVRFYPWRSKQTSMDVVTTVSGTAGTVYSVPLPADAAAGDFVAVGVRRNGSTFDVDCVMDPTVALRG